MLWNPVGQGRGLLTIIDAILHYGCNTVAEAYRSFATFGALRAGRRWARIHISDDASKAI